MVSVNISTNFGVPLGGPATVVEPQLSDAAARKNP